MNIMREGIHPEYHQATVTCNCGNTFVTGSTKENIHVEICSNVAVLINSTRNTVLNRKQTQQAEVEASQPLCFIR